MGQRVFILSYREWGYPHHYLFSLLVEVKFISKVMTVTRTKGTKNNGCAHPFLGPYEGWHSQHLPVLLYPNYSWHNYAQYVTLDEISRCKKVSFMGLMFLYTQIMFFQATTVSMTVFLLLSTTISGSL